MSKYIFYNSLIKEILAVYMSLYKINTIWIEILNKNVE